MVQRERSRWALGVMLVLTSMGVTAHPAEAATQLQGFYEAFLQGTSGDETWQLARPNHYIELRALSTPATNVEAFVEVSASSNRFRTQNAGYNPITNTLSDNVNVHDPKVFFNEGHLKIRRSKAEVLFFSSQNRFWFSQPLLQIVDGNQLQDDRDGPRAQAVRVDFWDTFGIGGLAYYGDKATNGEDFVAGRLYRPFLRNRILTGFTFGRKEFDSDSYEASDSYDLSLAGDLEFALGELIPGLENFGRSTLVFEGGANLSGWLDNEDDTPVGLQSELRDVSWNAINFKGGVWYREQDFYTGLSGRQNDDDQRGFYAETWFRLPRKQVDLRYRLFGRSDISDIRTTSSGELGEDVWEQELQLYAELKGGFSSWIKFKEFHTNNNQDSDVFRNVVFELQAQNKLISVRPQIRVRDLDTPFEVWGYGMEINFNATDTWKFFSRVLNAQENTESRRTVFVQARYNGFQNAEFFVEYGDGGRSDRLTENDGFVQEGESAVSQDYDRRVQAFLKLWF